ncbi:hypothetical protein [Nitratireductor pacificus]|uniref:Uncharacterized protein n=1 Tax=Nitratireductor pacificus pht-3B TaxID=391937 RepID=K2M7Q1_9HYPH|nr:hypothetical protein [Nitratireductor pacificus]EKF17035.1 hypothetical protein NA2_19733 [Nitratireductor pacificus pht-3B]
MVRVETALSELREIVASGTRPDMARCRRLLIRATSAMPDLNLASLLSDRAGVLIATLELVEALGSERHYQVDMVMDVLDEIEEAGRPQ